MLSLLRQIDSCCQYIIDACIIFYCCHLPILWQLLYSLFMIILVFYIVYNSKYTSDHLNVCKFTKNTLTRIRKFFTVKWLYTIKLLFKKNITTMNSIIVLTIKSSTCVLMNGYIMYYLHLHCIHQEYNVLTLF